MLQCSRAHTGHIRYGTLTVDYESNQPFRLFVQEWRVTAHLSIVAYTSTFAL